MKADTVVEPGPQIRLPDLSAIVVDVPTNDVNDRQVAEHLERWRQDLRALTVVDRPARVGDVVEIDLIATIDGVDAEQGQAGNIPHEVGSGHLLAGLDEAVAGMSAGESTTIKTQLVGGPDLGRSADLTISVRRVTAQQQPDLDDEFAVEVGGVATIEALRGKIREWLFQAGRAGQLHAARDAALRAVSTGADVVVPDGVVRDEVQRHRQSLVDALERNGSCLSEHLAAAEKTEESIDAELRRIVAQRTSAQLVLDAIADAEQIRVSSDDLCEATVRRAGRARLEPHTYAQQLLHDGVVGALYEDVRRSKALAILLQRVVIKDTDGNVLSLDGLRGVPPPMPAVDGIDRHDKESL
jgi:trigger factor